MHQSLGNNNLFRLGRDKVVGSVSYYLLEKRKNKSNHPIFMMFFLINWISKFAVNQFYNFINRPGVAGAVLQSPLSFNN